MDLTAAITNFTQTATISKIQIAVAQKLLQNQKLDGNAALKLLDSASGNAAQAGDQLAAAATGLGGALDTYA